MPQLRECRTRDHLPQIAPARIGSDGGRAPRVAQVDGCARASPGALDRFRESHIVEQGMADCGNTADAVQSLTADEDCASRGGGYRRAWSVLAGEWIGQLK